MEGANAGALARGLAHPGTSTLLRMEGADAGGVAGVYWIWPWSRWNLAEKLLRLGCGVGGLGGNFAGLDRRILNTLISTRTCHELLEMT